MIKILGLKKKILLFKKLRNIIIRMLLLKPKIFIIMIIMIIIVLFKIYSLLIITIMKIIKIIVK